MINRFYLLVLIIFLVAGETRTSFSQTSEISSQKWAEIKSQFKEKYASESPSPTERRAASQLVNPCWGFFIDQKNAAEGN